TVDRPARRRHRRAPAARSTGADRPCPPLPGPLAWAERPIADLTTPRCGVRGFRLRRRGAVRVPGRSQVGEPLETAGYGPHLRSFGAVRPGGVHRPPGRTGAHATA